MENTSPARLFCKIFSPLNLSLISRKGAFSEQQKNEFDQNILFLFFERIILS